MGNVIPFDGTVTDGEGMVNQASLTGESVPVRKIPGGTVYAGTVVEEGELTICVKAWLPATASRCTSKIVPTLGQFQAVGARLPPRCPLSPAAASHSRLMLPAPR